MRPGAGDALPARRRSGALAADQFSVPLHCQLAAVVHEETAGAAELVGLHGQHLDGQFLVGQVGTGQLEALRHLDLVDVNCARLRVGPAGLQLLEAVLAEVDLIATRSVVVGGHRSSLSCIDESLGVSNAKDEVSVPGSTRRFLTLLLPSE